MAVNLRGKSFLTLMDFEPEEIRYLLDLAKDLKANARSGIRSQMLKGKNICLLFEKTSTRNVSTGSRPGGSSSTTETSRSP